jgi:hypothetical protein
VDIRQYKIAIVHDIFDAFGRNTLVAYYLHFAARRNTYAYLPQDSPPGIVFVGILLCMGPLYLAMAHLRKTKTFLSV